MKTTKWILACTLAVSMTAATIWAQKGAPEGTDSGEITGRHSLELDVLVDIAEMDLLADMVDSLLREEENDDSKSIADPTIPDNGFCCIPGMDTGIPGMDMGIPGGEFGVADMGGFGGFPIMVSFNGMSGFSQTGGFSGYPMMWGFGGMGGFGGF